MALLRLRPGKPPPADPRLFVSFDVGEELNFSILRQENRSSISSGTLTPDSSDDGVLFLYGRRRPRLRPGRVQQVSVHLRLTPGFARMNCGTAVSTRGGTDADGLAISSLRVAPIGLPGHREPRERSVDAFAPTNCAKFHETRPSGRTSLPHYSWRSMLEALGALVYRHRLGVLVAAAAFLAASVAMLFVGGPLTSGEIDGIESERAERVVNEILGRDRETTVIAVFRSA